MESVITDKDSRMKRRRKYVRVRVGVRPFTMCHFRKARAQGARPVIPNNHASALNSGLFFKSVQFSSIKAVIGMGKGYLHCQNKCEIMTGKKIHEQENWDFSVMKMCLQIVTVMQTCS